MVLLVTAHHVASSGTSHWVFPKNTGTPKWMMKIMENPVKMDDLGVRLFSETSHSGCFSLLQLWQEPRSSCADHVASQAALPRVTWRHQRGNLCNPPFHTSEKVTKMEKWCFDGFLGYIVRNSKKNIVL